MSSCQLSLNSINLDIYASGHAITNDAQAGDLKPDLLIIAPRSNGDHHTVWDSQRGTTKRLRTNEAGGDTTDSPALVTFESNGFDIDTTDINYNIYVHKMFLTILSHVDKNIHNTPPHLRNKKYDNVLFQFLFLQNKE